MTFTQTQIDILRAKYSKINGIDPFGKTYPKLIAFLDGLSQEQLKMLVEAKIKFISGLARNRIAA